MLNITTITSKITNFGKCEELQQICLHITESIFSEEFLGKKPHTNPTEIMGIHAISTTFLKMLIYTTNCIIQNYCSNSTIFHDKFGPLVWKLERIESQKYQYHHNSDYSDKFD